VEERILCGIIKRGEWLKILSSNFTRSSHVRLDNAILNNIVCSGATTTLNFYQDNFGTVVGVFFLISTLINRAS
jgi:hypothetical protein